MEQTKGQTLSNKRQQWATYRAKTEQKRSNSGAKINKLGYL